MKNVKNNKGLKLIVIILVLFVVVIFLKDQIIKSIVEVAASKVLGTDIHIGGLSFGVLRQSVRVKDLKVKNPKGFPEGIMLDVPEAGVDYDLPALLKGKMHFPVIILNLNEVVVVKNKDGQLNVDALNVVKKKEAGEPQPEEKEPSKHLPLKIDVLRLNVNRVIYKDYSQGTEPFIQVFDVGLKNKTYKDIDSAQQLVALVLVEAMKPTAIKGAKIYGISALLGAGFLPAGIAGMLIGEDSGQQEFAVGYDQAYRAALEVLKGKGSIKSENKDEGIIKADVRGHDVTARLTKLGQNKTEVVIAARQFFIPKPAMAQGILYELQERLK